MDIKQCFIAFFPLISLSAYSEVLLQERFEHYLIAAKEIDQIKLELRNNSPVSTKEQVFHGGTEWTLVPNFRWKKEQFLCRIKDVHVKLNGTYTMPKLEHSLTVSTSTKERFDDYYQALLAHEKGHQELWLEAGNEIEKLLLSFPPHFSCHELASQAKKQVGQIILRFQNSNKEYDQATGHGRTQGASIR